MSIGAMRRGREGLCDAAKAKAKFYRRVTPIL
jgi:hypothetical protein